MMIIQTRANRKVSGGFRLLCLTKIENIPASRETGKAHEIWDLRRKWLLARIML
jgi:hypothetical protein